SSFASCGGTAADRRFSVEVPGAGYAAAGDVARLENTASVAERIAYLEAHSLTPTDAFRPDQLVNLLTRGHPSPFPHSLSAIRMCLRPMRATGPWKVTDVELVNGEPQVVIRVTYPVAHFLGRGMPAAPGGVPDGLHIGIRWGHGVTDAEVPDLVYAQPEFEVRLPVAVESGRITYGAPQVTRRGPARQWSGTFQGPGSARRRLESYANARMQQVAREIGKAFGATRTKNAISSAIMSRLQSRGVTQVSALRRLSPD